MKESETGRERESYTVQIYLGISIITRVLIHGVCYITNNKKRQIENTAILAYQKQNQLGSNVYRKHGDYKIC